MSFSTLLRGATTEPLSTNEFTFWLLRHRKRPGLHGSKFEQDGLAGMFNGSKRPSRSPANQKDLPMVSQGIESTKRSK